MGKNKKGKSMRKRKLKRRLKRILENNRKTVDKGWDTQKISRRGEEKEVKLSLWGRILNWFRSKR